jgi:hypothetical protein
MGLSLPPDAALSSGLRRASFFCRRTPPASSIGANSITFVSSSGLSLPAPGRDLGIRFHAMSREAHLRRRGIIPLIEFHIPCTSHSNFWCLCRAALGSVQKTGKIYVALNFYLVKSMAYK